MVRFGFFLTWSSIISWLRVFEKRFWLITLCCRLFDGSAESSGVVDRETIRNIRPYIYPVPATNLVWEDVKVIYKKFSTAWGLVIKTSMRIVAAALPMIWSHDLMCLVNFETVLHVDDVVIRLEISSYVVILITISERPFLGSQSSCLELLNANVPMWGYIICEAH